MSFDTIVLGAGGMGSAALYHLARRGQRVLGIERFAPGHDRGSSHGQTRLIRKAYFEHPDYVPLLHRAYQLWDELSAERGQGLFARSGLLLCGPEASAVIAGVRRAASAHQLDIRDVPAAARAARFPGFALQDNDTVLFEPDAGFLYVEACVQAHAELAVAHGAQLRCGEQVLGIAADAGGVTVTTQAGRYRAGQLVVCAGAWTGPLVAHLALPLALPLTIRRKTLLWVQTEDPAYHRDHGGPAFGFVEPDGFFYGFPALDERGVKVALHTGGEELPDADARGDELRPADVPPIMDFLLRRLPGVRGPISGHAACLYTMTPDEDFIIDRHPQHPQILLCCGFSGHGFKFASVVGEVAADLVTAGRTAQPISFLSLSRPSLRR